MKFTPTWTGIICVLFIGLCVGFYFGYLSTLHKIDLRAQEIGWMEYRDGQWQYKAQYKYEVNYLKYGTTKEK